MHRLHSEASETTSETFKPVWCLRSCDLIIFTFYLIISEFYRDILSYNTLSLKGILGLAGVSCYFFSFTDGKGLPCDSHLTLSKIKCISVSVHRKLCKIYADKHTPDNPLAVQSSAPSLYLALT